MRRIFTTSLNLLLVVVLLNFSPDSAHGDLITNGDFETLVANNGTGGGWTSTSIGAGGWASTGGNPAGNYILNQAGAATSDPTVQQTISGLDIGSTYQLSFEYALHFSIAPNGNSFAVFLDTQTNPLLLENSDAIFFGENLTTNYVSETVNFVATDNTHTLFFSAEVDNRTNGGLGNSDVSYRLDNVSLVAAAVPEPTCASLFATVGLCCGLRRRRIK